ncbi:MAG: hypothetical protein K0R00_961 [Herbinix sp.]|jgi:uncharacterized protein YqhQ|nr:hypothetical protein [Herbinix sp.]
MRPSGIGGMAVMEGVMMKNKDQYAIAVRKPNNEIVVEKSTHKDFSDKVKLFKLPVFRGMLAFVDSMVIGVKVLNFSASFFEDEEEVNKGKKKRSKTSEQDFEIEEISATKAEDAIDINSKKEPMLDVEKGNKSNALLMLLAVVLSIGLSIALFMVLPVLVTNLFKTFIESNFVITLIEGFVRLGIFIGYVVLASQMKEIKRVFMYHGAEHKTINCMENGFELTVENIRWQSKLHKRCGTSFMLLVILISLIIFLIIPINDVFLKVISRVLLVPFIAGISYEFIRLAGKSEGKVVEILSMPGLWMQSLTTKEPDDSMIEVAIKSVEGVYDWRAFLAKADGKATKVKATETKAKEKATVVKDNGTGGKSKNTKKQNGITNPSESKQSNELKPGNESKQSKDLKQSKDSKQSKESKQSNELKQSKELKLTGDSQVMEQKSLPKTKPSTAKHIEEEDDEILKALDKFFDNGPADVVNR